MTEEQLKNKDLNHIECSNRQLKLQSGPVNITFCANYKCNMKCIFCLERGNDPDFSLDVYKGLFMDKLGSSVKRATHLFNTGWGEILLHPRIGDFLDYLNKALPGITKVFTTNGVPLNKELISKMIEGQYYLQVSLHACDPLIHRLLTRSNSFEQIADQLSYLRYLRKERGVSHLDINLIFMATALNIENLPDFVDFAGSLGINSIACNYFTIFKPEHIRLSCFFLKDTTNRMFEEARQRAKKHNIRLSLPPEFGTKADLNADRFCRDPWEHVFVDASGNILPCCSAGDNIGNLKDEDFLSIWNGNEYVELRRSLAEGRLNDRCRNCFKFSPMNVDDIRSHITFRQGLQKIIFQELGLEP